MTQTGTIYDAVTNLPVPVATVAIYNNGNPTGEGTVADVSGNFSVYISDPNSYMRISSIGYTTAEVSPNGGSEAIYLNPNMNELPGVTVTAPAPTNTTTTTQATNNPNWAEMKPLLIGVLIIFVVGYLIAQSHDNTSRRATR